MRVIVDIEFSAGGNVAHTSHGSAHDDQAIDQPCQTRVSLEGSSNIGERTKRDDGDISGICTDRIRNHFFRGVLVMEFGNIPVQVAEARIPV